MKSRARGTKPSSPKEPSANPELDDSLIIVEYDE
jgi:hypothetical protein